MKIGKFEFGVVLEPVKKDGKYIYKPRTLKWFLKEIFSFDKIHYNLYRAPCKCLMLDLGPFYFTVLSKECK